FSSRRRHTRSKRDWSSDVCSSDLKRLPLVVTFRGSDLLGEVGRGGRYTLVGKLLQRMSRAVARRADAVIVVSEHMKAQLPRGVRSEERRVGKECGWGRWTGAESKY